MLTEPGAGAAQLHIELLAQPPDLPADCSALSRSPSLSVLKGADDTVYLCFADALVAIAPGQTRASVWLAEGFEALPLKEQQIRLTLLMVWLLQSQGLTPLHGAALVRQGRALVLTAVSGGGKSTTAFTLVCGGWQLCADDITLLDCRSPQPQVWPLARGLSAAAGSAQPGWQLLDAAIVTGKQLLEPAGGTLDQPAPLAGLLFPRVEAASPSQLLPVRGAEALIRLLPGVGGILTGLPSANGRMQELAALCASLPCHTLRLGSDVHKNPAALMALLGQTGL